MTTLLIPDKNMIIPRYVIDEKILSKVDIPNNNIKAKQKIRDNKQ